MQKRKAELGIVLKEEQVLFGGLSIYYRFCVRAEKGEPRFLIAVTLGEENAVREIGTHLMRALNTYQKIVGGAVTPCSLDDVLADITVA